jgi:2-oxoglutarate ferredoxin oxidoreductase subunit beta
MEDDTYMVLRKIDKDYDPTDRSAALDLLTESYKNKYFATGLIYFSETVETIQDLYDLPDEPLNRLSAERLRPTKAMLDEINRALR